MKPTLILVGADKGGVGKTTLSRALMDFFVRKNILTRAFDTENPRGTLKRFYPANTEIVDFANVADQMRILDTLETANVKVTIVDLKAGNLSLVLDTFDKIGALEAARNGEFSLGLFHVVGSAVASLDEIAEISKYTDGLNYVLARNFINDTNFFEWDEKTYKKYFASIPEAREIDVPKLNEMAYEQIDLAGVTYKDFIDNKTATGDAGNFSFVLRGYTRKWVEDLDKELQHLDLIKAVLAGDRAEGKSKG
jgi:hypothetical protein